MASLQGMLKPRANPNTKTMAGNAIRASQIDANQLRTSITTQDRHKSNADGVKHLPSSFNILERIQSKIEEKMTRADTSNG